MITVGNRIPLFTDAAVLPYGANKSDATAGVPVDFGLSAQRGPVAMAVYFEASITATISGVRLHGFENVEPTPAGEWAELMAESGQVVLASLSLVAGRPRKIVFSNPGVNSRLLVEVSDLAGALLTCQVQRMANG